MREKEKQGVLTKKKKIYIYIYRRASGRQVSSGRCRPRLTGEGFHPPKRAGGRSGTIFYVPLMFGPLIQIIPSHFILFYFFNF